MSNRFFKACVVVATLGLAREAMASNPIKWQVSVGPEAVLTKVGGARMPFSINSNPSPAMLPTELFPAVIPPKQIDYTLRGEVRVYFAVAGFPPGSRGGDETETASYQLTLEELRLEKVVIGDSIRWKIPDAEYARILERLRESRTRVGVKG